MIVTKITRKPYGYIEVDGLYCNELYLNRRQVISISCDYNNGENKLSIETCASFIELVFNGASEEFSNLSYATQQEVAYLSDFFGVFFEKGETADVDG